MDREHESGRYAHEWQPWNQEHFQGGPEGYGSYNQGQRFSMERDRGFERPLGGSWGPDINESRRSDFGRGGFGSGLGGREYGDSEGYRGMNDGGNGGYGGGYGWGGYGGGYASRFGAGWEGGNMGGWNAGPDRMSSWRWRDGWREGNRMGSSFDPRQREFIGRGPKGYTRSDERIRENVCERLSEGYIDASDVEVMVQNGEVTLSGMVPDRRSKRMAEELVESAPGVKDVENKLKVKPEARSQPVSANKSEPMSGASRESAASRRTGASA